jgi:MFS family permease
VLLAALAVAAVGFAIFWLAAVPWLALAGLVVCGLGISMHYPLGMALAVTHSGGQPDLAAARTSYALGLAFGVAPFALGAVADTAGPHRAFLILPVFLGLSATVIAVLSRSTSAGQREPVSDRQQHAVDTVVAECDLVELHDGADVGRITGIKDPAAA